ncbi:hypothetical protein BB560_006612, partial [Smittium megazygosporum]
TDPDFEKITSAFTKLTDVSHWALGILGYVGIETIRAFLIWLMSSELSLIRSKIDSIMKSADINSEEYILYKSNKRLLQDEVIYKIITFNSETASHLILAFYDMATHPNIRNQLRQEQAKLCSDISKISPKDPIIKINTYPSEFFADSDDIDGFSDDELESNAESNRYHDLDSISGFHRRIHRIPSTPSLVSYVNDLSQNVLDTVSVDSRADRLNTTVSEDTTTPQPATENNDQDRSSDNPISAQADSVQLSSDTSIASSIHEKEANSTTVTINELGFNDYPLNISGAGPNLLSKSKTYHNNTSDINLLTLNMTRTFPLLNACILESFRVCPPICSQLWIVKKKFSDGFTKHTALLLSETNSLNKGDLLGFCSSAVFDYNSDIQSTDTKVESETAKEEYTYESTSMTNETETEQVSTNISSYDNFMPVENWPLNSSSQNELLDVLGYNRSLNYDFIRILLSHLLVRTDFSTFEWGKPRTKDNFLLYSSLFNSSLMFRLQRKFN